ncbi:hypothetical protein ACQP2X_39340 [Actinoplanes sp. CA-131856]
MSYRQPSPSVGHVEADLVAYVRGHARLIDDGHQRPAGYAYSSTPHLLLAHGRLFAPAVRPGAIERMRDHFCFENAAAVAREQNLIYAEGFAAFTTASGLTMPLPHAWCLTTDGAVVDPTWDNGDAYLGIAFTDTTLLPSSNRGLLDDHRNSDRFLREGLAPGTYTDLGRPLPVDPA